MNDLIPLYNAAQVREFDRRAIEQCGIPGATLMMRAGSVAFTALRTRWPKAWRIVVVCGTGNNAGDGFVLARLARAAGCITSVLQVGDAARLRGDARQAFDDYRAAGGVTHAFTPPALDKADVLVDALFGIGLTRDIEGDWRLAVEAMNTASAPVLALDTPSGIHADTGAVLGVAVRAELTVTFIGHKQGLFTGAGLAHSGRVVFDTLNVPEAVYSSAMPPSQLLTQTDLSAWLPPRQRGAHKGQFGHVLVIGGEQGMSGATRLAAEAAARVGAGLVSIATRAVHAAVLNATRPELMCIGVEHVEQLAPLLERATVIAVGPGLGRGEWGRVIFRRVLDTQLPMIVDADALNLLALEPTRRDNWILTPHPGEAARLLGCTTAEINADRYHAVRELVARFGGVAVLKGAGTLVACEAEPVAVCDAGNPGMASGGMGDVLTGVIAGLSAQGLGLFTAAQLGVLVHALSGDAAAAEQGERGLLASDVVAQLRRFANPAA